MMFNMEKKDKITEVTLGDKEVEEKPKESKEEKKPKKIFLRKLGTFYGMKNLL